VWHHILLHHQFLGLNLQIVGVSFGHYPFERPWSRCNLMSSTHFEFKSLIETKLKLYINCYEPIEMKKLKIIHNSRYIKCPISLIIYTLSSNAIKCHQVHLNHSFFGNNYPYSLVHLVLNINCFHEAIPLTIDVFFNFQKFKAKITLHAHALVTFHNWKFPCTWISLVTI